MMNRRQFLQTAAGAAAILGLQRRAFGYAVSPGLRKFVTPLPVFGGGGSLDPTVAVPDTATYPGMDYYEIEAGVYRQQLHPDLPAGGTRLFGYRQVNTTGAANTHKHLGGAIVAQKDRPVRVKFTCNLPFQHILPYDASIPMDANAAARPDRAAIHLHGGLVPWTSDGGPFHWVTNPLNGALLEGASRPGTAWLQDLNSALTNDYFYPNHQSARFMWYHDHAVGITRTNAYAGIATGYIVQDSVESGLGLPFGDILVFQDKVFYDPAIDPNYGLYAGSGVLSGASMGDLWYPYLYEKQIWKLAASNNKKLAAIVPVPSCVAEMFGDTMLVNGTVYPYQNVQSGTYRYRLLNACNARFLNLSFAMEDPANPGEPLLVTNNNRLAPVWAAVKVWQIATEGGFLPTPVLLADTTGAAGAAPPAPLLLGPAERADIIVDFSSVPQGANVILYNDAAAPFPGGSGMFDWYFGAAGVAAGFGPNTRTPMMFKRVNGTAPTIAVPATIPSVPEVPRVPDTTNGGYKLVTAVGSSTAPAKGDTVTLKDGSPFTFGGEVNLTLNEAFDAFGRLEQLVGGVLPQAGGGFGTPYIGASGEHVTYGSIYLWNIFNLTADAHPMHVHLFNAWILRRRPFRVNQFAGVPPVWTAIGRGPDPNEEGWKETFKMYPGECITLAVVVEDPFNLPDPGTGVHGSSSTARTFTFNVRRSRGSSVSVTTGPLPYSPRLGALGITNSDEYVWHCHILEHEEHDMMHYLAGS